MAGVSAPRWPLTARDVELEALSGAWSARQIRGVVVAGPAGVGKTRLAAEFLAGAAGERIRCARVTASAAAGAVPLGAIAHLIPPGVDLSDPVSGFAQVARVLAGPDRSRRWALMVDDLHLLDATSAVLLGQLVDAGVVRLIGTVRTGEPLAEPTAALVAREAMHRIDLKVFTPAQVEAVLQSTLGGPVIRQAVREMAAASGGNALYLRELVTGALASGVLTWDGEIWQLAEDRSRSGTLRLAELIGARLAGADPSARQVLELLAVCESVSLADAQAVADGHGLVARLEEAGLVQVTTDRNRTSVMLAHPLYGEALRARLPVLRCRQLLLAQVNRVRVRGARRRDDTLHIAAWQLAATGTADPAQLVQAAALARYAHDYPQALALLEALPEGKHTTATRLMLGEVLFEVGQPEQAERVLAHAWANAQGEQEALAVTLTRCLSLFWATGRTQEALTVNDAARTRVVSENGRRMLRYNEGAMRIASGEPVAGLALLDDLGDDVRQAPDPAAWLHGAMMKPVGLEMTGRIDQALAFAEHAYRAHLAVGDHVLYPHPSTQLIILSYALRRHGQLDRARTVGERGHAEAAVTGVPVVTMWMALNLAEAELLAGHPAAARRWYADAAAQARKCHYARALNPALNGLAACAALLGDLKAAEQAIDEANTYPRLGIFLDRGHMARAWLASARGDLDNARSLLADAAAEARNAGLVAMEAFLLTDVARLGAARQVTGRLAELAAVCDGAFVPACARFAEALAADDPDGLSAVAKELVVIGADLMAAEAASAAAAAYSSEGHAHKAAAATAQAQTCAVRCEGASTPLLTTASTTTMLTPRERDIALLAAHGTPSKDIAETLHLSVRTVENHLQHAYTKLGVTTRRELARILIASTGGTA